MHRVPLGSTSWSVWRDAFLRTTGFPVDGLDLLAAPDCAEAADAYLAGTAGPDEFQAKFQESLAKGAEHVCAIAANPKFREAITWQNPAVTVLLDALGRSGRAGPRNTRRRYREQQLSRFWQRYCAKAETIGFFGPGLWITIDENTEYVSARPGAGLLARRQVFLEPWALAAYGARLAEDPDIKLWLPPAPLPHYFLDHGCLHRPGMPTVTLSAAQAAALRLCDGTQPAARVVAALRADPALALRSDTQGYELLADLEARKLLTWDANLPITPETGALLASRIAAIGDDGPRRRAQAGLARLTTAADAVADAAGQPQALTAALASLDAEFTAVTNREPRRRQGRTYAGRGVCYEDTTRDLHVVIGRRFLDGISPALTVVLQAARWVTSEVARVYEEALQELFLSMAAGGRDIVLSDLWYPAIELFHGLGRKPVDDVMEMLAARWDEMFGTAAAPPGTRRCDFTAAGLAERLHQVFPAHRPGWSLARIHSPDLHICASSAEAINAGDFLAVLGEIHIAFATLGGTCATWSQPDPCRIRKLAIHDAGQRRILPLFPAAWHRDPGRNVQIEHDPADWQIGFARTKGVDARRLIPIQSVPVFMAGDRLAGMTPDGRCVPLLEFFAFFLSTVVVNAFRAVSTAPHTPRITIDRLVVVRETWRMCLDDISSLTDISLRDEAGQYLAARRLAAEHGLPDRCFVKISTETKPCYVDFTSPLYVSSLCSMLRAANASTGGNARVTITEMLPAPGQAWVPDAAGRRYFGEIRLHVTDPAQADSMLAPPATALTWQPAEGGCPAEGSCAGGRGHGR